MDVVSEVGERKERPPWVRFERRAVENKKASREQGHYVGKDMDFALITPAYTTECIEMKVERFFENQERYVHAGRTPREWLDHWRKGYEAWKKNEEMPLYGTAIKNWPAISPAQAKLVISTGILTVEDLAGCNHEGLRRLGMGGRDLIDKAKSWVKATEEQGKVAIENAQLTKENEQLKQTVENLEGKVAELQRMMEQKRGVSVEVESTSMIDEILEDPAPTWQKEILQEPAQTLEDQYYAKFGKKPHWKMKPETIRQKLEE